MYLFIHYFIRTSYSNWLISRRSILFRRIKLVCNKSLNWLLLLERKKTLSSTRFNSRPLLSILVLMQILILWSNVSCAIITQFQKKFCFWGWRPVRPASPAWPQTGGRRGRSPGHRQRSPVAEIEKNKYLCLIFSSSFSS